MKDIKGTFVLAKPETILEQEDLPKGWFVISHRWVDDKEERRFQHGKWFKLSAKNKASVYRVLRFSPQLKYDPEGKSEIVLDWPAWLDLLDSAEKSKDPMEIKITTVRWWWYPKLAISHPDPVFRLAGWLALLSVALGVVSVALGLWSVWKTYNP